MPYPQKANSQEKKEVRSPKEVFNQKSLGVLNTMNLYSVSEIFREILYPDENSNAQCQQSAVKFGGIRYSIFFRFIGLAMTRFLCASFLELRRASKFADGLTLKVDIDSFAKKNQNAQNYAHSIFANIYLDNVEMLSSSQEPRVSPHTKAILEKH